MGLCLHVHVVLTLPLACPVHTRYVLSVGGKMTHLNQITRIVPGAPTVKV